MVMQVDHGVDNPGIATADTVKNASCPWPLHAGEEPDEMRQRKEEVVKVARAVKRVHNVVEQLEGFVLIAMDRLECGGL